jgi:signal peptidase I
MKTYKETFETWHKKYLGKKDYFVSRIEKMKNRFSKRLYNHCSQLLENLEKEEQEIKKLVQEQAEDKKFATHTKRFKKYYKELNELTKPVWRQWIESIGVALFLLLILRNFIFGLYHVPTGSAEPTLLVGDRIFGNKMSYYFSDVKRGEYIILDQPDFKYDHSSMIKLFWQKYVGFGIPALGLPNGAASWTKRVIGIPGDTVEGRIEDGKPVVYLNGTKLNEPYVNPYPLICAKKTIGFFDEHNFMSSLLPFFKKRPTEHADHNGTVWYTYNPALAPYDQPFYKLYNEEIERSSISNEPMFRQPDAASEHDIFGPFKLPEGKYWVMGDSRKNSMDSRYWLFLDKSAIQGRVSFIIWSVDSEEMFWFFELIKHPIDFWTRSLRWDRFFKFIKHEPAN